MDSTELVIKTRDSKELETLHVAIMLYLENNIPFDPVVSVYII